MGKWVEVKCNCPNRGPIVKSDRKNTHILTYPCGHTDGVLYQNSPNELFEIAEFLQIYLKEYPDWAATFVVFNKLFRWRYAPFEQLSVDESRMWQLEFEELMLLEVGKSTMPFNVVRNWQAQSKIVMARPYSLTMKEAIECGLRLCEASISSGNPIEFQD